MGLEELWQEIRLWYTLDEPLQGGAKLLGSYLVGVGHRAGCTDFGGGK